MNWKLILLCAVFSVTVWWIIDSTASPKTAEKLHRAAATMFKWLLVIFVIGGVIGLQTDSPQPGGTLVGTRDVLFIDANQYLYLYQTVSGKKLLGLLHEQRDHILVTQQIADEVYRNKVHVTAAFILEWLKKLELNRLANGGYVLPVHAALGQISSGLARNQSAAESATRFGGR